jgi:predicted small lipoprotein YifL
MRNKLLLAALASTLVLSACGIKGALYLPEPPAAPTAGADHNKDATPQTPKQ